MTNQNNDKFNFLGRALFMVLFLLVICAHFDRSEKQTYFASQYKLITEMNSISNHAVSVGFFQTPIIQKSLPSGIDRSGLLLFNGTFKIVFDNCRINQKIILQQKKSFQIKPDCDFRFQYHLSRVDTGEPPYLS